MNTKKITFAGLIIIIVALIFLIMLIDGRFLSKNSDYRVTDINGKKIEALIFLNHKTIAHAPTEEIILYFPEIKTYKFITLAIPPESIGYNDYGSGYLFIGNLLYFNRNSLMFTPLNDGYDMMIHHYQFGDDTISFETFDEFKKYGSTIMVIKQETTSK